MSHAVGLVSLIRLAVRSGLSKLMEETQMAQVIEMVRFTVKPGEEQVLVDERPAMLFALAANFAGMIDARLAKLDGETWVDLVTWESREQALAAADGAGRIPEVASWFSHIGEVHAMEHADVVVGAG